MKADGTIVIDTAIQDDGFQAGTKELESAARRMATKVDALGNKVRVAISKQLNSFTKLNEAYAKQEQKVDELRKAVEKYDNQQIPTQEYREIQEQIDEARKKMVALIAAQDRYINTGGKQNSSAFKRRQYDIEELANTIKYAEGELKDLEETGKAFTLGTSTEKASEAARKLKNEEEKLNDMNRRLNISYADLKNRVQSYTTSTSSTERATRQISRTVSGLASGISNAGRRIQKFAAGAGKTVKNLALAMLGLNKNTKQTQMTMGRMLATSLLFSSVFRIISAVTGGIGEGMSNLAQYSDETNQSISALMSALTRLKNSFATAFAPLLSVVVPALTTFINAISQAITYVGMLIAALTGQDSFVKAVGVQEDYAGSLEDTSSAAQDAEKSLNGYLSPLDNISKYEKKNVSSGSSGGLPGYEAPKPGDMFETVPIKNSIKNLADKIKKLIKSQDWEGLGNLIASGLNKGLEKVYDVISWDNVGPKITAFVDAFTGTFNSLVDNLDWDLIGRTIGSGVNTLVNTLNLLIEGIDWTNLGSKVAAGIYGLFNEIDWTNLGNLIGNKFMILWNFLYGLVTDLDWGQLGVAVGNGINGAFEKINFETIGSTLARIFNGAVDFLKKSTQTIKWSEIADNVSAGINKSFSEINPAEAGKALSDFVTSLLGMLLDIVKQTDWAEVGRSIGEFLGSIDWGKIISQVGQIIWEAFSGILAGLFDTGSGKVIIGFIAGLKGIELAFKAVNLAVTASKWVSSIAPAFSSLVSAAGGLVSKLGTILAPIANVIFSPQGAIVVAIIGCVGLIIQNWDKIKQAASDLVGWLGEKGKEIVDWASGVGKQVSDFFSTSWENISTKTSEIFGDISSEFSRIAGNVKKNATSMADGVKNTVTKAWNLTKTATTNTWNSIKTTARTIWNGMTTSASTMANKILSSVQTAWNNAKSTTSSAWNGIKTNLSTVWNGLKTIASTAFGNVKTAISNTWNSIKSLTTNIWNGITKSLSTIWGNIKSTANSAFTGIKSVISSAWNGVKNTTSSVWKSIYSTVSSYWSKIKSFLGNIGSGIKSFFTGGSSRSRTVTFQSANVLASKPIPYLATGAVIPPNAPFMAVLGDQKRGNNIEAPENLIRKIVREESGNKGFSGTIRIPITLNGRQIFEAVIDEAKLKQMISGRNPFEMA